MSLSCHAFALLSRAPNVPESIVISFVICDLSFIVVHCRCIAIFAHLLLFFFSGHRCLCLLLFLSYRPHKSGLFFSPLQPFLTLLSAWTVFFIHCIIITHVFLLSLLDAVLSVALPPTRPNHAIIDLPSSSAVTGRLVVDRYAAKIYEYTFSK